MRYSKPIEGQNETAERRFWAKVDRSGECWMWTASLIDGYGQFRIGGEGSRNVKAHIVAFLWENGPIPSGMVLDHLCRNRACVNPDHLEVVTPEENSTRGMLSRHATNERCAHGHLWSENAGRPPSGYRVCRACQAEKRSDPERLAYQRAYQREWKRARGER